ncbi:MAG: MBL fold metallo-hydrolase [Acidimicrobiia bacterium]|nr:MBL fold metallo-hydrolase [Acidimicrobiia bacterium]
MAGLYDWIEHGDGVFSKRYECLDLNIGVVVCGEGALVIDTRAHHEQARRLLEDLSRITPHPVRWVANTHHHWDHTFGNAAFLPVPIWGHERCALALRLRGEQMRREVKEWAPGSAGLFDEVVITPPDHTFDRSATLTLAGRVIELRYLGRGHTDNDIVALVPDAGVLFAGDLVEESGPPAFHDAFPLEWPETAAALLPLASGPVVPGHGAVVDLGFVQAQQRDLAAVATLALERHALGMTPAQAGSAGGPFPVEVLAIAFARAWPGLEMG